VTMRSQYDGDAVEPHTLGEQDARGQKNTSLCPQVADNKGTLEEQSQTKPNFGAPDALPRNEALRKLSSDKLPLRVAPELRRCNPIGPRSVSVGSPGWGLSRRKTPIHSAKKPLDDKLLA
jgi:hypothetical protein